MQTSAFKPSGNAHIDSAETRAFQPFPRRFHSPEQSAQSRLARKHRQLPRPYVPLLANLRLYL